MTKQQREDAAWWRRLARGYERRTKRVTQGMSTQYCRGLCGVVEFGCYNDDNGRRYEQLHAVGETKDFRYWWSEVALGVPEAYDLRATACGLIAAMVEAGDA